MDIIKIILGSAGESSCAYFRYGIMAHGSPPHFGYYFGLGWGEGFPAKTEESL
jgi:hypothetical protein